MPRWPNVTLLAVTHLNAVLDARAVSRIPGNLEEVLPLNRAIVAGGADDGINDQPTLDVESFAASEGEMWTLAEGTREAMHDLAGRAVDGKLVDSVETVARPFPLDYGNPGVHRAVATYRLTLRAQ